MRGSAAAGAGDGARSGDEAARLGTLSARSGKAREAREHLAIATGMHREMDMPYWLAQAEAETSA